MYQTNKESQTNPWPSPAYPCCSAAAGIWAVLWAKVFYPCSPPSGGGHIALVSFLWLNVVFCLWNVIQRFLSLESWLVWSVVARARFISSEMSHLWRSDEQYHRNSCFSSLSMVKRWVTCFVGGSRFSTSLIPAISNADVSVGDRRPGSRERQQSSGQCSQRTAVDTAVSWAVLRNLSSSSNVICCTDKCSVKCRRKAGTKLTGRHLSW